MPATGGLIIPLDVDDDPFVMGLRRADQQLKSSSAKMNRSLARVELGFQKASRGAAAMARSIVPLTAAIGAMVAAVGGFRAADFALQLSDTAQALGVTTDALQEFRFAAGQAGLATNQADQALQRFIRRVGEAQAGGGELKSTLEELNIPITELGRNRDPLDVLADFADALEEMESGADRLRAAFKAFDSEGARVVGTVGRGAEALREMAEQARILGLVLNEELVERGADVGRFWELLWGGIQNLAVEFGIRFGEIMQAATLALLEFVSLASEKLAEFAEKLGIDGLAGSLRDASQGIREYVDALEAASKSSDDAAKSTSGLEIEIRNTKKAAEESWAVFRGMAGSIDDEVNSSLERTAPLIADMTEEAKSFGREMGQALEDVIRGTKSFGEALRDVAISALSRSASSALESGLGTLFSSVTGSIFGGARAQGGQVQGGTAYRVGEFGPEYFVPAMSGAIVPAGGGGGNQFFIDATGADVAAVRRLEAAVVRLDGSIEYRAVRAQADESRRTGGRRF